MNAAGRVGGLHAGVLRNFLRHAQRPASPGRLWARPLLCLPLRYDPKLSCAFVPTAITVHNLAKRYGRVVALDGVSFSVAEGEVLALLGPNGAGKTTAVEILEGYRRADQGEINVLGHDPATGGSKFRDRIGIVLQETGIEQVLTVRETIDLYGASYTRRREPDELIALVGLEEKADARIKTLSGGQRRRLDLALALVGDPDLIFLDEPTTGFDPAARRKSWKLVEGLTDLGKTILLTTHYLDEAQNLADRIVVLNGGGSWLKEPPRHWAAPDRLPPYSSAFLTRRIFLPSGKRRRWMDTALPTARTTRPFSCTGSRAGPPAGVWSWPALK